MFSKDQINWLYQSEINRGTKAEKRIDSVLLELSEADGEMDSEFIEWWGDYGRFQYGKESWSNEDRWRKAYVLSKNHHRMTIALAMPEREKR